MSDSNKTTIDSYNEHVNEYINGTPQIVDGDVKVWIDKALSYVPTDGKVLELGSAFGRDALYIESAGLKVDRTDGTEAFVKLLQEQGHKARVLDAITDDFGGDYDMVFANAVLLHFTPTEVARVLIKAHDSLKSDGVLAFTVKQGDGEEWSDAKLDSPRYFCYWQEAGLRKSVEEAGFKVVDLSFGSTKNADWLQVIARVV